MATIKSYTDLEQSKVLAEILPLESADMFWKNGISNKYIQCFTPFVIDEYGTNVDYDYDVPCWSLTALLKVLPDDCGIDKEDGKYVATYLISNECALTLVTILLMLATK